METLSNNNGHSIVLDLPYPPSVNHYWRRVGNRTLISKNGRAYRREVDARVTIFGFKDDPLIGRINASFTAHPPDRRRRDLDNLLKAMLDALEHAGVYHDDSQIDSLTIDRGEIVRGGSVSAYLYSVGDGEAAGECA